MRKSSWYLLFCLGLAASCAATIASAQPAAHAAAKQPVYIYLYARVTDHVNLDLSEAQLRALLPMVEQFRKEHPDAHVSATVLFSGAASDALEKRNAQTGIKDYVLGYEKSGVIEIGYDGIDEPTYEHRPVVNAMMGKSYQERWLDRAAQDEKFLTEARDPLRGTPIPGESGGLKRMQEVFGTAAALNGISVGQEEPYEPKLDPRTPGLGPTPTVKPEVGDWEVVPVLRRYNTEAILFGLPANNPAHVPGFGGSILSLGQILAPSPNLSPELFWADNVLRSSESAGLGARVIHGYEGSAALNEFTAKLDRSKVRIVHMELVSENDFLKPDFAKAPLSPTLSYAYGHPDSPEFPKEDRQSAEATKAALERESESLNWLVSDFFPGNPGSHFVSNAQLKAMTPPSTDFSVPMDTVQDSLRDILSDWGANTYPPPYFQLGNHYVSLAEAFQSFADALAQYKKTGALPNSIRIGRIHGPLIMPSSHGPNVGEVTVSSVADVCSKVAPGLHDDSGDPMPKNVVPPVLDMNGVTLNAAQFLRLMTEAIADPVAQKALRIRMTYMAPGTAQVFPKTRTLDDTGATWTFKPAPLNVQMTAEGSH